MRFVTTRGRRAPTATATIMAAAPAAGPADGEVADVGRQLGDVVGRHDGRVVGVAGDDVLAAFDAASEALAAAVEMQVLLSRPGPNPRIGVAAGDVTWDDTECRGHAVAVARDLLQTARSGEILVSDAVRILAGDMVPGRFDVVEAGEAGAGATAMCRGCSGRHQRPPTRPDRHRARRSRCHCGLPARTPSSAGPVRSRRSPRRGGSLGTGARGPRRW